MIILIRIAIFSFFFVLLEAHVRLTFPPGRKFAVDFLDNQRTFGLCGMPPGNVPTRLASGKSYTVSWYMGLLHQGTFQIELFNATGKIMDFVNWDQSKNASITTQSHYIQIPQNLKCTNCTIRLLREAQEFSTKERPYIFWSCADVNIVPFELEGREQCSGNGGLEQPSGKCSCDEGFIGKYCELRTECSKDLDCGRHGRGKCIKLSEIKEHAIGQCFCEFPYFGEKCSNRVKSESQTLQEFKLKLKKNLNKYRKLHLLKDEIALYYKVANDSGVEPQIEFVLQAKSTSFIGLGWRPAELTRDCKRTWPKNGQNLRQHRSGLADHFKAEVTESRKNYGQFNEISKHLLKTHEFEHAPFSAMDCTDMIISSVQGNHSRIRDYYTMDRSTPQQDSFWGGVDNIIFATGWESGSTTTVVFRRNVFSTDTSVDHNLIGNLHLIWSRGQTFTPNSNPTFSKFYAKDELKYHGYGPNQRGILNVQFY